jgi:hypothetical protein
MAIHQVKQTDAIICAQLDAMRSDTFELLMLHFAESGRQGGVTRTTRDRLIARLPWLKAKNVQGWNINIRPTGNHLSMLDDLSKEQVASLETSGYQPCVVVETSPGNYQAWLDHGRDLSDDEATEFSKILAKTLGADIAAAGRRHAGRLAGFTNRKPSRRLVSGLFPFVQLHLAQRRVFDAASALTLPPPCPIPARPRMPQGFPTAPKLKTIEQFHSDRRYDNDYSRSDFAYAIYAHSHGVDENTIVENILSRDMSKKGNEVAQRRYALYTSRRARAKARPRNFAV